ncbi:LytTR family DNA-binding domain-containing protein [Mesorhizobium sp. LHD-90]|uniref:LytR/AlgR family response regulator transcription factor n=1 Tax=Mesorhizobium sp. LHD-90 TaxID=3071414 RepID=UPI0027E1456B|nr:LytTR family DNA-binding domain-containing protein [Mesorhizobium sp. LHD-90]MDQ6437575.1 LytTR family DNA-binding domain-containing protein [Mesorhizobium sp. LHD-90]
MLRVMLVDDEPPARRGLRRLMQAHADAEIVGEAGSVRQAREMALALRPDALFLDIELADGLGFDMLDQLSPPPAVVFVTAHDSYALKAFDVAAMDFLLKPVDPDRLAVTVERLRQRQIMTATPAQQQGNGADTAHLSEQRLHLRIGGQSTIVALNKITLLKAEEDFTRIFVAGERDHLVCRLLRHFEAQLPTPPFFRVSRSFIVNLARLENIQWLGSGRCSFSVGEGIAPISLGRHAAQRLRRCIDEIGMVSA